MYRDSAYCAYCYAKLARRLATIATTTLLSTLVSAAPTIPSDFNPVLVDGSFRRGTDVLKALGTGASAVLIGRPYLYGLAVGGAEGVTRVINILRREFEMAMALTGKTSIAAIDSSVIWK